MHPLHQGPIDSILEQTILRYCVQMHPNEPFTAIISSMHQNLRHLAKNTLTTINWQLPCNAASLPEFCPSLTHPKCLLFRCQLEASPEVNAEKTKKTTPSQRMSVLRCWKWCSLDSWFTNPSQNTIPNKTMQLQDCSEWPRIGTWELNKNESWKHPVFHMWFRTVRGAPAKLCRSWRLWVVQFLQFKHNFSTISWRTSGLNSRVASHPVQIQQHPSPAIQVCSAEMHLGCNL